MKLSKLIFPSVLLLTAVGLSAPLLAQDLPMIPAFARETPLRGITVTGHDHIKAAPDVAYEDFTVTDSSRREPDLERSNARIMQAVMDAIKGVVGIDAKDIETQDYTISPNYDDQKSPERVTGYTASNSITVTIHDLSKVGSVIDAAVQAGAVSAGDVQFDLIDRSKIERQVLSGAVSDARENAAAAAKAAGVGLGTLLNLTNSLPENPQPMPMFAGAMVARGMEAATPISPQQMDISADVTVTFAIAAE